MLTAFRLTALSTQLLNKNSMKKTAILLLFVAAVISFTQCNESAVNEVANAGERGKIISALMNNGAYMNEVMDSMKVKHGVEMAKNDHTMQAEMMEKTMANCKMDPAMCKSMMDKTMEMCDADQSRCDMMMGAMKPHPNVMKSMKGMCDMEGMNMEKKQ